MIQKKALQSKWLQEGAWLVYFLLSKDRHSPVKKAGKPGLPCKRSFQKPKRLNNNVLKTFLRALHGTPGTIK
jgi:hypothetical protein